MYKQISVIHPSRNRVNEAYATFKNWISKADSFKNFNYILSVDHDDIRNGSGSYLAWGMPDGLNFRSMIEWNKNAVQAINIAAKYTDFELLLVISDDFDCPEHWDTLLLNEVKDCKDFLLKTQDGLQKTLITLPIMDRTYYNRFGYVYHPDYLHMHADEEMTIVGHMLGRVITSDLFFEHKHYSAHKSVRDEINERNNATWGHGVRTLERRAKNNFGIENPLVKREDIVWK